MYTSCRKNIPEHTGADCNARRLMLLLARLHWDKEGFLRTVSKLMFDENDKKVTHSELLGSLTTLMVTVMLELLCNSSIVISIWSTVDSIDEVKQNLIDIKLVNTDIPLRNIPWVTLENVPLPTILTGVTVKV